MVQFCRSAAMKQHTVPVIVIYQDPKADDSLSKHAYSLRSMRAVCLANGGSHQAYARAVRGPMLGGRETAVVRLGWPVHDAVPQASDAELRDIAQAHVSRINRTAFDTAELHVAAVVIYGRRCRKAFAGLEREIKVPVLHAERGLETVEVHRWAKGLTMPKPLVIVPPVCLAYTPPSVPVVTSKPTAPTPKPVAQMPTKKCGMLKAPMRKILVRRVKPHA